VSRTTRVPVETSKPGVCHDYMNRVFALQTISHESQHLSGIRDEATAECNGMQQLAWFARHFGATAEQARQMAGDYYRDLYQVERPGQLGSEREQLHRARCEQPLEQGRDRGSTRAPNTVDCNMKPPIADGGDADHRQGENRLQVPLDRPWVRYVPRGVSARSNTKSQGPGADHGQLTCLNLCKHEMRQMRM